MRLDRTRRRCAAFLLGATALLHWPACLHAQDTSEPTLLDTLVVEAESDDTLEQDGYVAKKDRDGTKIDTPIAKIPQAVSVITQDQIEDQKPKTLNDALGYTASANPNSYGFDTRYDAFFLRGFQAYYNGVFRDGLRQYNGPSAWFKTEPYGIEGVTILKTMLDAWAPAAAAAAQAKAEGKDMPSILSSAIEAARAGAEATKSMIAAKGRSSRLGERSLGHIDPGAASTVTILEAMQKGLAG